MRTKKPYGQPTPLNPKYDFDAFVRRVKSLDYAEMVIRAESACATAERASYESAGAVAAREAGSTIFAGRLKDLLHFLRTGNLPRSQYTDTRLYHEIAESLVAKGQWKKTALDIFKSQG